VWPFQTRAEPPRVEFPRVDYPATFFADPANRQRFLSQLYAYVESFAAEQSAWYMKHRVVRQMVSLWIRFFSLVFLFLGGLCPLIPKDIILRGRVLDFEPWGYFLIGFGGGLLLFDHLFGISSSWMRFIWAAFEIDAVLDQFRIRWMKSQLEAESPVTFSALIAAAEDAINRIRTIIMLETSAWRTEVQSNIARQMSLYRSQDRSQANGEGSGDGHAGNGAGRRR
jgi:SMODS and SLOG-associating 2TM effector domain 2